MPTMLITGAGGFIGRHVARCAQELPDGPDVHLLAHQNRVRATGRHGRIVTADLTRPVTLQGLCDGVDVLVHCASQIGGPDELCEAVNAKGTTALVTEAQRAGVPRIVYVSTASVYGRGPFTNACAEQLLRRPVSATSRTRAHAEDAVLAAGGTVLRPHIVYGTGDRWVARGLVDLLRAVQGSVEGWAALISVIDVECLARAVVCTALAAAARLKAPVYHANHPQPVASRILLRAFADAADLSWPSDALSAAQASELLHARGGSLNHLKMMTTDHWFDSTQLWDDLGSDPGPGFHGRIARHSAWYRHVLQEEPYTSLSVAPV